MRELEPLVESYHAARLRWVYDHPTVGDGSCRYCARRWVRWPGSRLDGHAACYVPLGFMRDLVAYVSARPLVTFEDVAIALGVTLAVVRAWWAVGSGARKPRAGNA